MALAGLVPAILSLIPPILSVGAAILATPAAHSAALVIPAVPPSAAGASERARTRAHADLEHGLGTQRRVDDPHVLDHRAFDVEKLVEYAVHQALFGCVFSWSLNILPKKRSSLTPPTTQRRNPTHENSNSAQLSHLLFPSNKNGGLL